MKPHDELKWSNSSTRRSARSPTARLRARWSRAFSPASLRAGFAVVAAIVRPLAGAGPRGVSCAGRRLAAGSCCSVPQFRRCAARGPRIPGPLGQVRVVSTFVADLSETIFRSIPTLWLYGVVAFIATLYAALVGLGATAYRTLIVNR